jgi:hypothetical protein
VVCRLRALRRHVGDICGSRRGRGAVMRPRRLRAGRVVTHVFDDPRCAGLRDDARRADRRELRDASVEDCRDVQPCSARDATGAAAQKQDDGGCGGDGNEACHDERAARETRLGAGRRRVAGGRIGRWVMLGSLDDSVDSGRALAPEVIGHETGGLGFGWGRGRGAEGHEMLARAEPIPRQADDLVRSLRRTPCLDLTTFLHPLPTFSSYSFLCRPDRALVYAWISSSWTQLATN